MDGSTNADRATDYRSGFYDIARHHKRQQHICAHLKRGHSDPYRFGRYRHPYGDHRWNSNYLLATSGGQIMRYIVSGLHRTGTSALVRAISEASTLTAHVDADVEAVIRSRETDPTYNPNPAGYFSHATMFSPIADWITDTPDGSVMKAAPEAFLQGTGSEPLMVILTSRPANQIEASFAAAFGMDVPDHRYTARAQAQAILEQASNVVLTIVNFADLIDTPERVFAALAFTGWPINAPVAAATIDPSLYRNIL